MIKEQKNEQKVRPIGISILTIYVLCLAAWNGLRFVETIFFWKTLGQYGSHALYIAIAGGMWLLIGLFIDWGLWLGKVWGWSTALCGIVGYDIWYWFDLLIMQKLHVNWPFLLVANLVFLLIILILLMSHKTRHFFERDAYERKPQTPTIT